MAKKEAEEEAKKAEEEAKKAEEEAKKAEEEARKAVGKSPRGRKRKACPSAEDASQPNTKSPRMSERWNLLVYN
jgi:hypothetical protein